MDFKKRSQLIGAIISHLRFAAFLQKKQFDEAGTLFSLCFKSDIELDQIAKLARV